MVLVNAKRKVPSDFLLHALPIIAVFLTVMIITLFSWRGANQSMKVEREASINSKVSETTNDISERLESFRHILLGASGLFTSSEHVTRNEWEDFVKVFNIKKNFPGVRAMGYMTYSTRDNLPTVIERIRDSGFKNAEIHPDIDTGNYAVVTFITPEYSPSLGYNMFSHPARKNAINSARKTGEATISERVAYQKSEMPFEGVGFSMYYPVDTNIQQFSKPASQRDIQGFVFGSFEASKFFEIATRYTSDKLYGLKVYDGEIKNDKLLFQSKNFDQLAYSANFTNVSTIKPYGQDWILKFRFSPDIIAESTQHRSITVLAFGIVMAFLLSSLVLALLVARTRVLAHNKQVELQNAKDELLSLASHQLRTPATSVKQYVGMTLDGFGGALTSRQTDLLKKAYESNERQLHVINDILYVAKIDAKGIVLTPRRLNINKILQEIVKELSVIAKTNGQKIRLQLPKKQTFVEVDDHSIHMSIENIITNAMKYSDKGTTISVRLVPGKDEVEIIIKDKGVGIDEGDIPLLFQRFSRIPNELTSSVSGSGIGLYLSQQLIQLHNGAINVSSKKGIGTTFTVVLPKKHVPNHRSKIP